MDRKITQMPEFNGGDPVADIRRSVATICKKLGYDPRNVRSIEITPRGAVVQSYMLNERGYKYVDEVTGQVAVDTQTFKVRA